MTQEAPEVSVVLPTHNRSDLLALTLASVLWQQDADLEVIVVDDGSDDDTPAVVAGFDDPRVRLVRHECAQGVSAARNHGIAEARGTWVAFLDDDDVWAPDKLAAQLRAAREQGRGWVYVGAVNVTAGLRVLGGAPPLRPEEVVAGLPRTNLMPVGCSGVMVRRDLLPAKAFDSSYRHCADWDLWIRLTDLGPPAWVCRPLVGYRIHAGNASLDTRGMVAELDVIERRYGGPVDRPRFYRHVARVSQRASRRRDAVRFYLRAAAGDRRYLRDGLAADLTDIAGEVLRQARHRVRRALRLPQRVPPAHRAPNRRKDPHVAWRADAGPWLEQLARCSGRGSGSSPGG